MHVLAKHDRVARVVHLSPFGQGHYPYGIAWVASLPHRAQHRLQVSARPQCLLTDDASSEQAWECLQLLQRDLVPKVRFFSINIILSKVRHTWRQLQPEAGSRSKVLYGMLDNILKVLLACPVQC